MIEVEDLNRAGGAAAGLGDAARQRRERGPGAAAGESLPRAVMVMSVLLALLPSCAISSTLETIRPSL